MKFIKLILLLLLFGIFSSCKLVSFENLEIFCNLPEKVDYFESDNIVLNFSISPDHQDIEKNINLSLENSSIECEYEWIENTCCIKPQKGWTYGCTYEFIVSNLILMEDGRSYKINIQRIFYYGNKDNFLVLNNCSISDKSTIDFLTTIKFNFNKPVDIVSFVNNFSISPTISYNVEFSDENKTVLITPVDFWKPNSFYSWTLNDILSNDKYPLIKSYSQGFYTPIDTIQPEIELICPVKENNQTYSWLSNKKLDDLMIDNHIGIIFTEPIDFYTLKNSLSFSPNNEGDLIQNDIEGKKFIYVIKNYWNIEKEYQMTISKNVKDKNNISLHDDNIFYFKPKPDYFELEKIIIDQTEINVFDENINNILSTTNTNDISIYFFYNKNISDNFKDKAFESINLNSFFPSSALSPIILSVSWINDSTLKINYKGFSFNTSEVVNYYLLNITGGINVILDEFGNYLEKNICVYFTIQ